jgi:2-polyprenyl-3-methyl-5-hydroxy-6-metoxy-1,4-benzoquinol methylase
MLSQRGNYFPKKEKLYEEIIKSILNANLSGFKLLDIGCGDGCFLKHLLFQLREKTDINLGNVELVGIDHFPDYQRSFTEKEINFRLGNMFSIDQLYPPDYFDFVICTEVLEHIEATDELIKKIRRVLRRGGILYLTTPNLASYHGRLTLLLGFQPLVTEVSNENATFGKGFWDILYSGRERTGESIHHVRIFTPRALKEFLEFHQLEIINLDGFGHRFTGIWKHLPSLAPITRVFCRKPR